MDRRLLVLSIRWRSLFKSDHDSSICASHNFSGWIYPLTYRCCWYYRYASLQILPEWQPKTDVLLTAKYLGEANTSSNISKNILSKTLQHKFCRRKIMIYTGQNWVDIIKCCSGICMLLYFLDCNRQSRIYFFFPNWI